MFIKGLLSIIKSLLIIKNSLLIFKNDIQKNGNSCVPERE